LGENDVVSTPFIFGSTSSHAARHCNKKDIANVIRASATTQNSTLQLQSLLKKTNHHHHHHHHYYYHLSTITKRKKILKSQHKTINNNALLIILKYCDMLIISDSIVTSSRLDTQGSIPSRDTNFSLQNSSRAFQVLSNRHQRLFSWR
jgi:hypothetical protein